MPVLPEKASLAALQEYVSALEEERGFTEDTVLEKCLLLGEEVGELFKAVRKAQGMKVEKGSPDASVEEELADLLIYICSIANRFDIDLEAAFRAKEARNQEREWS